MALATHFHISHTKSTTNKLPSNDSLDSNRKKLQSKVCGTTKNRTFFPLSENKWCGCMCSFKWNKISSVPAQKENNISRIQWHYNSWYKHISVWPGVCALLLSIYNGVIGGAYNLCFYHLLVVNSFNLEKLWWCLVKTNFYAGWRWIILEIWAVNACWFRFLIIFSGLL